MTDEIKELRRMVEPVMEAAQKYGNTKQAFGQAYEGEREEAKQRYGKQLEPRWDAVKQAAMLVVAQARADEHILGCLDSFGGTGIVGCECARGGELAAVIAQLEEKQA